MVTNEELLMSYPDQWILVSGTQCQVESFNTSFDTVNSWFMNTPFEPEATGLTSGMIIQVTVNTGTSPKSGLYVIDSMASNGVILKLAGHSELLGRGPGITFGNSIVKATIFDFSPVIKNAYSLATAVVPERLILQDEQLQKQVDELVKRLVLLRLSVFSEELKAAMGLNHSSLMNLEQVMIENLRSDYLRSLAGRLGTSVNWTRIVR